MKIEELLKTKTIDNSYHKVYLNIMFSGIWLDGIVVKKLKPFGLSTPQFNILRILNGAKHPMTAASIQDRMLYRNSNVTRIIEKLVEKGLVKKSPNSKNMRIVDVTIEEEGKLLLKRVSPIVLNTEMEVVSKNLSVQEADFLSDLLDKLKS